MKYKNVSKSFKDSRKVPRGKIFLLLGLITMGGILLGVGLFWLKKELTEHFDILIIDGRIVDGTGSSIERKVIGIRDGKIKPVGWLFLTEADRTINAENCIVAPGFIDVHTHIEGNVSGNRKNSPIAAPNFLLQGITTIITGNCGTSAPSLSQFFGQLESQGIAVNVGSLVGHNTIRKQVMGSAARKPTEEELNRMMQSISLAMREGALGFSTGLEYAPGMFADEAEVQALAAVAAQYQGMYATHMRDEGNRVINSLQETLRVAKRVQIPVQISHLKWRGRVNWGGAQQLVDLIHKAQDGGLKVKCDAYPYTASSTSIDILIPKNARQGGTANLRTKLKDPVQRERIIEEILSQMKSEGWTDFSFARVAYCDFAPQYNGLLIPEITRLLNLPQPAPAETVRQSTTALKTKYKDGDISAKKIHLEKPESDKPVEQTVKWASARSQAEAICTLASRGFVQMIFESMSEEDISTILQFPDCMLGSDSGIRTGDGQPHPRGYGSAPRLLSRFAIEGKLFTLEEAVRKMTSLPAETFAIRERGKLLPDYHADIVIFSSDAIKDQATYDNPFRSPEGISYVLVNGEIAVERGQIMPVNAGQALRKSVLERRN
jgi:N-acyl-D-amino-acid deacylase